MEGVRDALQRGFRSTSDLASYAANIGANYIDINTIDHIFRGSNNGGVHHISAVMADQSTYNIRLLIEWKYQIPVDVTEQKYIKMEWKCIQDMLMEKVFFPDSWTENQVIDAIKAAHSSKSPIGGNTYLGSYNGLQIRMQIANFGTSSEYIISAYPN